MEASWVSCRFDLRGHNVLVAVRRLDADEQVRLAAEIAWHAAGLTACEPVRSAGWPDLLDRILTNDVAVTCSEDLWQGSRQLQDEIVCRAFEAFVTANQLGPGLLQHLLRRPALAS
ncbi:MAG TPA: hypothetical protein VKB36_15745 [Vicinamibacterales bacterium]|nr:hypothetical protein [Vicinamibacterales bacterium]